MSQQNCERFIVLPANDKVERSTMMTGKSVSIRLENALPQAITLWTPPSNSLVRVQVNF
jgi:hypothetical protein